MASYLSQFE